MRIINRSKWSHSCFTWSYERARGKRLWTMFVRMRRRPEQLRVMLMLLRGVGWNRVWQRRSRNGAGAQQKNCHTLYILFRSARNRPTYRQHVRWIYCVLCSVFCVLLLQDREAARPVAVRQTFCWEECPGPHGETERDALTVTHPVSNTHSVQPFCFKYELVCQDRLRTGSGQAQDSPMAFAS
jgi:hypothetical protein